MVTDIEDIFADMLTGVDEENLQQRAPIGTFDCTLVNDLTWAYRSGVGDDGNEWEITSVKAHVRVDRDVVNLSGRTAVGRHFFPEARYLNQLDGLARAIGLTPVKVTNHDKTYNSYIRALSPTFVPAKAEGNPFDGGEVGETAGRRLRVRVYLGEAKPVRGTDEMRAYPGYEFKAIPETEFDD